MDTIQIKLGFKIDEVFFGWHDGKLYQLPYNISGRYYGLRIMKPKLTKAGWLYYRLRRKKVGIEKIRAMLEPVTWEVKIPMSI
jgi:hypothetical protein